MLYTTTPLQRSEQIKNRGLFAPGDELPQRLVHSFLFGCFTAQFERAVQKIGVDIQIWFHWWMVSHSTPHIKEPPREQT